jgi:integrase
MSAPGIRVRHQRACRSPAGGRCNCNPTYEASVGAGERGRKLRQSFATLAAAKAWQTEARHAIGRGQLSAASTVTVRAAALDLIAKMESGLLRTPAGAPYKPSVIRGYECNLRLHVLPELGGHKLNRLRRRDVQLLADRMLAAGKDPSTIRNTLVPLRTIYRRAIDMGDIAVSPVSGVRLPAPEGTRDRIATPAQAAELISALRVDDQALWGSAFYAGLRLGELRALRWADVDLAKGLIRVERGMDQKGSIIPPKSKAGRRAVPVPKALRALLAMHRLQRVGDGYVFGSSLTAPFTPTAVHRRARLRWAKVKELKPLADFGLHEARHTFASMAIAAGVNAKALTIYMGHASVQITYDRYGHLMPGNEREAAGLLDVYLQDSVALGGDGA